MNNIFDSHAHYDDKKFKDDLDDVMKLLQNSGVTNVLNAGCDIKSSKKSIALSEKYPFIYASVGIHPHEADEAPADYLHQLELLSQHEKVVAIGEIGLDYHYDFSPREIQKRVFKEQLQLANKLKLPVIIHNREAHEDTLTALREVPSKGIIHCYSGSAEMAKVLVNMGFYIGFTGVVTFSNARRALEAIKVIPLNRLLIETDCPYMAPVPFRGKRCDSSMLVQTADVIAKVKGISLQELCDITNQNAKTVFQIK